MALPTEYWIRDVRIAPAVVLAPMEGVTDVTFRRLVRQIGDCGLTTTEFVASEGLTRNVAKMHEMCAFDEDERPIAIQIYGRRPEALAEAARMVQDMGPTIVDLNMGCPSKKVCAHSGGSALLKDPVLAREIVRAMRKALHLPFTVKMRSGFDHDQRNAPEIAHMCQEEGVEAITIHWRTRSDGYSGERAVDKIADTKRRLSIPVIANGDIVDIPSAIRMVEDTGCDGVMVGRGAIRNPWVIRQIAQHFRGEIPTVVTGEERGRVLLGYLEDIRRRFRTEHAALGRFKKIVNYFTKGVPYGGSVRMAILRSETLEEAKDHALVFFDKLGRFERGEAVFAGMDGFAEGQGDGSKEARALEASAGEGRPLSVPDNRHNPVLG
jgi:tRNA-dihydrouridine synthase B